jgi:hypothetical protein
MSVCLAGQSPWLAGQSAIGQATGSIKGKVTDVSGGAVLGAVVTVESAEGSRNMTVTDGDGAFQISSLTLGNYSVKVSAYGLADWTAANVPTSVTPEANPLVVVLQVAPTTTSVTVGVGPEEVAAEQLKQELKQRVLVVLPNFYVTYESHPAPLSFMQKFKLGSRLLIDPATFAGVGITAGLQQGTNSYRQFGQGMEGFGKRFAADYATTVSSILFTDVVAAQAFHQDPRYFYSGQGTKGQRAWYAVAGAFRTKGDNGKWQPPYSSLAGWIASAELSEVYLPGSRTQYTLVARTLLFRFVGGVALNLAQEFFLNKLTRNARGGPSAANVPVLREGTPVPLIAVNRLSAGAVTTGDTVSFVLAQDLTVDGKVVAKTGDVASGQVGQVSPGKSPDDASNVGLERVTLRVGSVNVHLRSNQVREVVGPMQYKELAGSDKVEVTLYVAQSVQFPENQ